ncbi:uncharacterized protein LOC124978867 isoform X3 [Sciurus carolinensis]|uniref:uncharacterized protein LOC124978867 isoform X3 n=1 Tax=Sciurus carolinensis TaxID=30640 RepID=UPI001FB4D3E7|nr:uncharacterized protein LOC124978867 isoform X3 [Sciurus carolinensis]
MGTAGQECSQPVLTSNPNPPRCEERLPWPPPLGGPADASGATGASPWQPCQASLSCFYSTSARPPSLANQPYILLVFQHQRKRAQLFDFPPSLWQQLLRLHWPLPFSQAWNVDCVSHSSSQSQVLQTLTRHTVALYQVASNSTPSRTNKAQVAGVRHNQKCGQEEEDSTGSHRSQSATNLLEVGL